ncbi:unnamed protein product [Lota lota]
MAIGLNRAHLEWAGFWFTASFCCSHSLFRREPLGDSVVMPTASHCLCRVAAVSPQPPSTQASPCSCHRRMIIYLDLFN